MYEKYSVKTGKLSQVVVANEGVGLQEIFRRALLKHGDLGKLGSIVSFRRIPRGMEIFADTWAMLCESLPLDAAGDPFLCECLRLEGEAWVCSEKNGPCPEIGKRGGCQHDSA